jgi:predicted house-cleaning noncanonical NTP pyrophosphatase (MazG superfamily)
MEYNKLVRDKIPEILRSKELSYEVVCVCGREYKKRLYSKLVEEIGEYLESDNFEELADVLEVIDAICFVKGSSLEGLFNIKEAKKNERGGFCEGLVLKSVEEKK